MTQKAYIAASFKRRDEILIAEKVLSPFFDIVSTWTKEVEVGYFDDVSNQRKATQDMYDLDRADMLIHFSNGEGCGNMTELGIAINKGLKIVVIGQRKSIFHWLPSIEFYETLEEYLCTI